MNFGVSVCKVGQEVLLSRTALLWTYYPLINPRDIGRFRSIAPHDFHETKMLLCSIGSQPS
jgi:hypothetical protein